MKKLLIFLCALAVCGAASAQESNAGKRLWAKSVLNRKIPGIVVEKWLGEKPDMSGKFVIVDFWATWCPPCLSAIPKLNHLARVFADDVVVVGISGETEQSVRALTEPAIEYYLAVDPSNRMSKALEITGIPHVIVIDPRGVVRWEGLPTLKGHELTEKVVGKLIEKYR